MSDTLLEVRNLTKRFHGLLAVDDVSFSVPRRGVVGLIGPNGAGKTTCFNLIAGAIRPDAGEVILDGKSLTGQRADIACNAGIGRTFQIARPFPELTVEENVLVGALHRTANVAKARRKARDVLAMVGLDGRRTRNSATLTLPERKRLEVAKALATEPSVLLLDEVMAGLRPTEVDAMVAVFQRLNRDTGIAILLIEHVMRAAMALSHDVVVLRSGRVIMRGSPEEVVRDPQVIECYLGAEAL